MNDVPMDEWTPDEVEAHIQYMRDLAKRLEDTGEFVEHQALSPDGVWVRYDGEGRRPVTDGPFAETKDLIAGWTVIDVDSYERAIELAGELSSRARCRRRADSRVAGSPTVPHPAADRHRVTVDDVELRELVPQVLSVLVRRGGLRDGRGRRAGGAHPDGLGMGQGRPPIPGWLITVAWRVFIDMQRVGRARVATERSMPRPRPAWRGAATTRCTSTSCARIPS